MLKISENDKNMMRAVTISESEQLPMRDRSKTGDFVQFRYLLILFIFTTKSKNFK